MKVTRTHQFAAPIDRCWAMFHAPDSHAAKFTAMGHRDLEILECDRSDDRIRLVIERMVDVEVPGFARKVIQPSNRLRSVDEWRRIDDGRCTGEFVLTTQGVPIDITGTTLLTAEGDHSRYEVSVELKVRVPLIGGKIADFSKGIIDQQLTDEFRLGDEWLAAHP